MKIYLKELKFSSTKHTYLQDITPEIDKAIAKAKVEIGFCYVNTKHTTLGIVVNEIAEPNLLEDIIDHTKRHIPEDQRSTWINEQYIHPVTEYKHRCQDSPLKGSDEIDEDHNAGRHIRSLLYSHPSVIIPIRGGKLDLGKYQQVAFFEFDGRDGTGKNPIRQRTIQIWICPAEEIIEI